MARQITAKSGHQLLRLFSIPRPSDNVRLRQVVFRFDVNYRDSSSARETPKQSGRNLPGNATQTIALELNGINVYLGEESSSDFRQI
jgi:hypothetical protein